MYVLDPAADGNVHRSFAAAETPAAWAITVEPAGGAPTATGDIIYIASV
jgi:anti-sigma-K factor RskA